MIKDICYFVCKYVIVIFSFVKFFKDFFVVVCVFNDVFYWKNIEFCWIFFWFDWIEVFDYWMSVFDDDVGMGLGFKF